VFASKTWARIGLALNVAGAICLFYAFQATSSNFRLITTSSGDSALCVEQRAMMIASKDGGWVIGAMSCPDWVNAKPAAVVNIEKPILVTVGLLSTLAGFTLQFFTIPNDLTEDEINRNLRLLRKLRKQLAKQIENSNQSG
jgi:hypothetical protein